MGPVVWSGWDDLTLGSVDVRAEGTIAAGGRPRSLGLIDLLAAIRPGDVSGGVGRVLERAVREGHVELEAVAVEVV